MTHTSFPRSILEHDRAINLLSSSFDDRVMTRPIDRSIDGCRNDTCLMATQAKSLGLPTCSRRWYKANGQDGPSGPREGRKVSPSAKITPQADHFLAGKVVFLSSSQRIRKTLCFGASALRCIHVNHTSFKAASRAASYRGRGKSQTGSQDEASPNSPYEGWILRLPWTLLVRFTMFNFDRTICFR